MTITASELRQLAEKATPLTWIDDKVGGVIRRDTGEWICQTWLINEWDEKVGNIYNASPVWHLHESFERLRSLIHDYEFPRVCFGSSGEFAQVGTDRWNNRMNETFNEICIDGQPPCQIHMLRGMSLSGSIYPFASVDSTDVARNHNRPQNDAAKMAARWDAIQCPGRWASVPVQESLMELGGAKS